MFVPLTEAERQAFLKQTSGSFVPGYTGHCPTLKFQIGKCYGAGTKDIMQRLRDENFIRDSRVEYRVDDPHKYHLVPIKKVKDQSVDPAENIKRRQVRCILGYTGYIPGLNFRYGKSYGRAAEESMNDFFIKQHSLDEKLKSLQTVHNPVQLNTVRNRDDVCRALLDYTERVKYKEKSISPDCPPIAGYTGHIPRVKGSELSLSKRYNTVAQEGLTLLRQSQDRSYHMSDVDERIKQILNDQETSYLR